MKMDHYGLEFALQNSSEAITETAKRLEKVSCVRITSNNRRILKAGLAARMKVRDSKSALRRKEYIK